MIRSGGSSSGTYGSIFRTVPAIQELSQYHPVIIEGMGKYDPRNPTDVARHVHDQLQSHWWSQQSETKKMKKNQGGKVQEEQEEVERQAVGIGNSFSIANHCHFRRRLREDATVDGNDDIKKPKLVITQGDPLSERGISAITPIVADHLNVPRGLVYLDPEIADYHSRDADRTNVILEIKYSDMVRVLEETVRPDILTDIESAVDILLDDKNHKRQSVLNKPPLKSYFRDFALLQEVTKAACYQICGDLTVAHTAKTINEFSVTSFYQAGLDVGLYTKEQIVPYTVLDE